MAADHPRGRRIFNVVKSSQFAVHGPSQQPAVSSLDAPKLFKMPLTRESGPTTRESRGEMHPVEAGSRRQHGPNILASTVGGLEGFNRLDNENHTAQNGSDSRFFSVPTGPKRFLDQPVASRNSNISRNQQSSPSFSKPVESATLETQPTTRGALASSHEDTADLPSRLLSRRQPRDLRGRSSTPFVTHDGENDAGDHAPVDYAVFQSLLVAQSKKDKIMKEQVGSLLVVMTLMLNFPQDEELLQLEQEVQELQGQNSKLLSEIDRVKNETKSYIQNCKKMSVLPSATKISWV